jgi:probable rRNA maturation factor
VRGDVAIALVSDARMRSLNRSYRGKDQATDVLSFPVIISQGAWGPTPTRSRSAASRLARAAGAGDGDGHLGDIVIAKGVAARQARHAGHSVATEFRVLALHGLLHLIGYDHDDPKGRGRMARAERRLLRKGGLKAGLIHRS